MPNNAPDVIFFVGVGFSVDAGVSTMAKFVKEFEEHIRATDTNGHRYLTAIKKVMAESEGSDERVYNPDLEKLMDILRRFAQDKSVDMAAWQVIAKSDKGGLCG